MGYISDLGQVSSYTHCAYFNVKAKTNSGSTKITVSYLEPSSGRTLRAHTTITVYSPLEVVYPVKEHKHEAKRTILLPIGSSSKFVLTGGPRPWHGMPTAHFKQSKYIIHIYSTWFRLQMGTKSVTLKIPETPKTRGGRHQNVDPRTQPDPEKQTPTFAPRIHH